MKNRIPLSNFNLKPDSILLINKWIRQQAKPILTLSQIQIKVVELQAFSIENNITVILCTSDKGKLNKLS